MGGIHTVCSHTKTHAFALFAASSFSAHVPARPHSPGQMELGNSEFLCVSSGGHVARPLNGGGLYSRAHAEDIAQMQEHREAKTYAVEVVAGRLAVELALTVCLNVGDLLLLELFQHGADQGELQEMHGGKRAKRKERRQIGKASGEQVRAVPQARSQQARVRRC